MGGKQSAATLLSLQYRLHPFAPSSLRACKLGFFQLNSQRTLSTFKGSKAMARGAEKVNPQGEDDIPEAKGVPVFNNRRRNTDIVTKPAKKGRRRTSTFATGAALMAK